MVESFRAPSITSFNMWLRPQHPPTDRTPSATHLDNRSTSCRYRSWRFISTHACDNRVCCCALTLHCILARFLTLSSSSCSYSFFSEHVHDLLSFTGSSVSLDVREDVATGAFHVPNLSQHIVTNRDELIALIQRGNTQRRTTATVMNEYSSRSHSMLTITIEKSYKRKPSPDGMVEESTMVVQSQINLVDRQAHTHRQNAECGDCALVAAAYLRISLCSPLCPFSCRFRAPDDEQQGLDRKGDDGHQPQSQHARERDRRTHFRREGARTLP